MSELLEPDVFRLLTPWQRGSGAETPIANRATTVPALGRPLIRQHAVTVSDYINPLVLRYALWGTKVTQRWGIGCTDWLIGDIPKIWELWEWQRKLYILRGRMTG